LNAGNKFEQRFSRSSILEGLVIAPPNIPGWDGFPIRDTLIERWGCPFTLNNDADLRGFRECDYEAAGNENTLAFIKVGTRNGAGLVIDGQIVGVPAAPL